MSPKKMNLVNTTYLPGLKKKKDVFTPLTEFYVPILTCYLVNVSILILLRKTESEDRLGSE